MIVTSQSKVETQQARESRKEIQKSSDRFSRLLDGHARQQRESDAVVGRDQKAQILKDRETAALHPDTAIGGPVHGASGADAGIANTEINKAQAPEPATPSRIHKLAEELGQQVELHRVAGNTHAIDITFHSRSLSGLQVQIREAKGELAIRFVTRSVVTSGLLSRHSQSLKESLVSKGLKIQNIVIANGFAPATSFGGRSAES